MLTLTISVEYNAEPIQASNILFLQRHQIVKGRMEEKQHTGMFRREGVNMHCLKTVVLIWIKFLYATTLDLTTTTTTFPLHN